jgi:hypothetical protein
VNDSIKDLLSNIRISDLVEMSDTHADQSAAVGGGLVSILA